MKDASLLRHLLGLARGERKSAGIVARAKMRGWFDGQKVTPKGLEAVRQGAIEAEARSATALGNANVSRESGRPNAAEQHLRTSQRYLDLANVLRGYD
jgi:hypothetical protein